MDRQHFRRMALAILELELQIPKKRRAELKNPAQRILELQHRKVIDYSEGGMGLRAFLF